MIEQVYNLVTKPGVMFRLWFRGRCRKWVFEPHTDGAGRTVYAADPCLRIRFHRGECKR